MSMLKRLIQHTHLPLRGRLDDSQLPSNPILTQLVCRCISIVLVALFSVFVGHAQSPEIWFGPFDNLVRPSLKYVGPQDFIQLFTPTAPWSQASQKTKVLDITWYLILGLSDSDLQNMIADLARRQIKLAVDIEAIPYDGTCGRGYEGFGNLATIQATASRIKAAGGTWDIASMDEPFWDAAIDNRVNPNNVPPGPGAIPCLWSADQVASKVSQTVALLRQQFPKIAIGDIELMDENSSNSALTQQYANWMDAYLKATGTPLAFFHADVAFQYSDANARVLSVRDVVRARQIPFGIIYNGLGATSNSSGCNQQSGT